MEVFAGQPWPELDDGVGFTPVPGLDLYRDPDPFRVPHPREFRSREDLLEFAVMCTAGFPEPRTFSRRARRMLAERRAEFDIVHDNQCLGSGLLGMLEDGWPLLTTLHHPITVDRELALAHAENAYRRLTQRRWFGFLGMQIRVAQELPTVVTVSESSKGDIAAQMKVPLERMTVVPVGVDHTVFRPRPERAPGRGADHGDVLERRPHEGSGASARGGGQAADRTPRRAGGHRPAHRGGRVARTIERLGLADVVAAHSGISDDELAVLYAEAQVAVVPSLYEGFSLPAIEAMACGVPLVATTGGALPEVVGTDGETGLLVPPDDAEALAGGIRRIMDDPALAARLGAGGRDRVLGRFTWEATARGRPSSTGWSWPTPERERRADRRLPTARGEPGRKASRPGLRLRPSRFPGRAAGGPGGGLRRRQRRGDPGPQHHRGHGRRR